MKTNRCYQYPLVLPRRVGRGPAKEKLTRSKRLVGLATAYCLIAVPLLIAKSQAQDFTYTNTNSTITITGYTGPGGNVDIPANIDGLPVTAIGGVAFMGNTNLAAITIPDTVTNMEDGLAFMASASGAFSFCSGLTNVVIGNHVVYIGAATFAYCTRLTRVSIPDSLTTLGLAAFDDCQSLTNVTLPAGLTTIGDYAFQDCVSLAGVYFKGNAPTWVGGSVFSGSSNVTVYYLPGTSGWGPTFAGRPTMLWNPTVQTTDSQFGVRQDPFGFNIAGTPDIPIVVEASADPSAPFWSALQTCTLTNGLLYFNDPGGRNYPERFYRIRSP